MKVTGCHDSESCGIFLLCKAGFFKSFGVIIFDSKGICSILKGILSGFRGFSKFSLTSHYVLLQLLGMDLSPRSSFWFCIIFLFPFRAAR